MEREEKERGGEVKYKIKIKAIPSKILTDTHKNIEINSNSDWIPNSLGKRMVIRQKSGPWTVPKEISAG